MILFPNAKINLGLNVHYKRSDGYHEIETVFYPLPFADVLEVLPGSFPFGSLTASGIPVDCPLAENLVYQSWQKLKKQYDIPAAGMHLHKNIPFGGGLGGGSSDAAFTLMALNRIFDLQLTPEQLEEKARELGSDCAFFIKNKPVLARGRGELFSSISLSLKGYYLILVAPPVTVSTREAYAGIKPAIPYYSVEWVISRPKEQWKEYLKNDFENTVFKLHPDMQQIKTGLYQMGAFYASMTGSGSAIFGLFDSLPEHLPASIAKDICWKGWL